MLKSQFVRHVATLMSGKVVSQAISLVAVPVIARLFNPDDFGVMAVFLSLVVILSNVAPLRYFRAGLIEKDENNANGLFIISLVSLLTISLLICAFTLVCRYYDISYLYKDTLGEWVWLLPAGVLLTGLTEILATANIRKKLFKTVAKADIANSLVMAVTRMAVGQAGSSVWGLMTGYFAGLVCQLALFVRGIADLGKLIKNLPAKSELRILAVKFKDFPLYNMPTSLMTEVSQNLPILMMGLIFAPDVIGLYAMADRLVRKPLGVMTKPLQDVFMVKAADITNKNNSLLKPFLKVTAGLLLLGIIPFTSLALYGQYVLEILLGSKWKDAGAYVEVLAPWYLATWVAICVRPVIIICRYQGSWLAIQIGALLMRALVFLASYVLGMSVMSTLVSFTIVNILITFGLLFFAVYILKSNAKSGTAY